ncbi:LysR family transcriptional regulator [Burkholderia sp. Ac-20353]|nr:LysR family transcriptional regulator [Burkholderia sp. Ac-20353]
MNFFIVFDAIYVKSKLARATDVLGITEPAVSKAFVRLRKTLNEPLFVGTMAGMLPTAESISDRVRDVSPIAIRGAFRPAAAFMLLQ